MQFDNLNRALLSSALLIVLSGLSSPSPVMVHRIPWFTLTGICGDNRHEMAAEVSLNGGGLATVPRLLAPEPGEARTMDRKGRTHNWPFLQAARFTRTMGR